MSFFIYLKGSPNTLSLGYVTEFWFLLLLLLPPPHPPHGLDAIKKQELTHHNGNSYPTFLGKRIGSLKVLMMYSVPFLLESPGSSLSAALGS